MLYPIMAAIAVGVARPAIFKLAGALVQAPALGTVGESIQARQKQLVLTQALRCALLMMAFAAALPFTDLRACGLALGDGAGVAGEIGVGVVAAVVMGLGWSVLHSFTPRENLVMADGAHDLSSATEDELLLGMRPALRIASLTARCIAVAFETFADAVLIYVFLPSAIEGVVPPTARRQSAVAVVAAALTYGSQHLRFRNEWLLCAGFGVALQALTSLALGGRLLSTVVTMELFAIGRHLRRIGEDARKFNAK